MPVTLNCETTLFQMSIEPMSLLWETGDLPLAANSPDHLFDQFPLCKGQSAVLMLVTETVCCCCIQSIFVLYLDVACAAATCLTGSMHDF